MYICKKTSAYMHKSTHTGRDTQRDAAASIYEHDHATQFNECNAPSFGGD